MVISSIDDYSEILIENGTDGPSYLVVAFGPFFPLYLAIVRQAYRIDRQICTYPYTTKVMYGRTLIDTGIHILPSKSVPGWDTLVYMHQHPQYVCDGQRTLSSHVVDMSGHATLVVLDSDRQSVEIYDPLCRAPTDHVRRYYAEKLSADLGGKWTLTFTSDHTSCPGLQDTQQQCRDEADVEFHDGTEVDHRPEAWRTMLCMFWVLYMLLMKSQSPLVSMSDLVRRFQTSIGAKESQQRILSFADHLSRIAIDVTRCNKCPVNQCMWRSFNQLTPEIVTERILRALSSTRVHKT